MAESFMSDLIEIRIVVAVAAAMVVASLLLNGFAAIGKHARRDHVAFTWLAATNVAFLLGSAGLLAAPVLPLWLSAALVILGMLFGLLIGFVALSYAIGDHPAPLGWISLGAVLGLAQGMLVMLTQDLTVVIVSSSGINGVLGVVLGRRLWRRSRHFGVELALLASAPFHAIGLAYLARLVLLWQGFGAYALAVATLMITLLMAFSALQWSFALLAFRAARMNRHLQIARDKAEVASTLKSRLLANMSHELRTPLNGVLGMAQALQPSVTDPRDTEMLAMMTDSAEQLLGRLNDILDHAALQSGTFALSNAPVNIRDILEHVIARHHKKARVNGVDLRLDMDPSCPLWWIGDRDRLTQIADKLVHNAVNFTAQGRIVLGAQATQQGLSLLFTDTGIGMSAAQQAVVFDAFVQADLSATRRVDGAGLGLPIARGLAKAMGGTLALNSAPGQGSTFTLSVPLDLAPAPPESVMAGDAAAAVENPPESPPDSATERQPRLLLAEDNKVNQRVLMAFLKDTGADLTLVENGLLAVEQASQQAFDLFLFDIMMPEMDGLTAYRKIAQDHLERGMQVPPAIAITANVAPEQVAEYRAAGFVDTLAKPVRKPELLALLARHIRRPDDPAPQMDDPSRLIA